MFTCYYPRSFFLSLIARLQLSFYVTTLIKKKIINIQISWIWTEQQWVESAWGCTLWWRCNEPANYIWYVYLYFNCTVASKYKFNHSFIQSFHPWLPARRGQGWRRWSGAEARPRRPPRPPFPHRSTAAWGSTSI